jgi:ATP-dependent DNA helicase RecG
VAARLEWDTPVQYVKGVGPKRAEALAAEGIRTVGDLLLYAPFRYEDRAAFRRIMELQEGETACVFGRIIASAARSTMRRRMKLFEMVVRDDSAAVNVIFFNQPYLRNVFKDGQHVVLYGRAERDTFTRSFRLQLRNPEFEIVEDDEDRTIHVGRVVPVYRKLGPLTGRQLRALLHPVVAALAEAPDPLPEALARRLGLVSRLAALREIHSPAVEAADPADRAATLAALNAGLSPAHRRMIFEEFFLLQTGLHYLHQGRRRVAKPHRIEVTDAIRDTVRRALPFKPTAAQKRVIREIVTDMTAPWPMHRLLQGDVGSGKTIVAAQAILVAVGNGHQAVLMAPTEILAEQHHAVLGRLLAHTGHAVELLTSSRPAAEKEAALRRIAAGESSVVVGTHAVIQKDVEFRRLALAIIDEQHRFGVMQRAELMRKGHTPDILVMTATPIPRTLALTVYGDLALSVIDEMPAGRVPVRTLLLQGERELPRAFDLVRREVAAGNQAFVIYPLIEESEKVDLKHALAGYRRLSEDVFPGVPVGLLHGRLAEDERTAAMEAFRRGELRVLVSTTVIEVGVDIPDATVMLVEHAERFGLSQLHQLRGRIGRSRKPGWCLLVAHGELTEDARRRLDVMVKTTDGFRIAEEDLAIRGPGEFSGTRQSGVLNFRFGSLIHHRDILEQARTEAETFVARAVAEPAGAEMAVLQRIRREWSDRFGLVLVG